MNEAVAKGEWKQLVGKIKQKWAKLTDDDLARAEGNYEELAGKIQSAYGYKKEQAWQEVERFKKENIAPKIDSEAKKDLN